MLRDLGAAEKFLEIETRSRTSAHYPKTKEHGERKGKKIKTLGELR
jgi:hypothetical protein